MHCALPPCAIPGKCGELTPPLVRGKRNALLIGDSISIQYAPTVRELLGDEWFVWKNGGSCTPQKTGFCAAEWNYIRQSDGLPNRVSCDVATGACDRRAFAAGWRRAVESKCARRGAAQPVDRGAAVGWDGLCS